MTLLRVGHDHTKSYSISAHRSHWMECDTNPPSLHIDLIEWNVTQTSTFFRRQTFDEQTQIFSRARLTGFLTTATLQVSWRQKILILEPRSCLLQMTRPGPRLLVLGMIIFVLCNKLALSFFGRRVLSLSSPATTRYVGCYGNRVSLNGKVLNAHNASDRCTSISLFLYCNQVSSLF